MRSVWFDGHTDFNIPETTSGFLDGTGLATAVGQCWIEMAHTVEDFRSVREGNMAPIRGVRRRSGREDAAA